MTGRDEPTTHVATTIDCGVCALKLTAFDTPFANVNVCPDAEDCTILMTAEVAPP